MDIKDLKSILNKYPNLKFDKENGVLKGYHDVDIDDIYNIEVYIQDFPIRYPIVYETGGRIKKDADWHIYTDTGSCCFGTEAQEQISVKTRVKTLEDFLDYIVIPYFQNNSYKEEFGVYYNGEYSHGALGNIESYRDILKVENLFLIQMLLKLRLRGFHFLSSSKCYCGLQKPIEKCHGIYYEQLFLINDKIIYRDLNSIVNYLVRNKK